MDLQGPASRRSFSKSTVAFAVAYAAMRPAEDLLALPSRPRTLAYVGTDTSPVDGTANGKGIYLFEMDRATGELSRIKLAAQSVNPSWLTLHPSGKARPDANQEHGAD